jgi:hypothetical protein
MTRRDTLSFKVKAKVTLRPTVSRPVRLGVRRSSGTRDQIFFLIETVFRQLRVCCFVAPTLTRGRVCNLLLLLVPLESVFCQYQSIVSQYVHKIFILSVWHSSGMYSYIQYVQGHFQSRLGTADYALVTSSLHSYDSLDTWTVVLMTAAKLSLLYFLSRACRVSMIE